MVAKVWLSRLHANAFLGLDGFVQALRVAAALASGGP